MIFNTTAAEVIDRAISRSTHYAIIKQLLYAAFGCVLAAGVWWIGYQNFIRLSGPFLIFFTVLLILCFVPGVGLQINGARRWIGIFGNSFQPSEFVKILIPLYYIHVITSHKEEITLRFFLKLMGLFAIPLTLILLEPDNGTVAIILSALVALFLLSKVKWRYWALPLGIVVLCGAAAASQMPHVANRLHVYLHPEDDLQGKGHQPYQAKIAAGSGKLFGKGLGESLQKLNYLPEARSDYIAAIYGEEFGFIGMLFLILLYMVIAYLGFFAAQSVSDPRAFYLISIVTFLICFQAFLNLGVVSGLLPSKGTNLPFFSHGGSSLLANIVALSLLLNASQKKRHAEKIR